MFATTDLAVYGESAVCADCKPAWAQRLRQGMTSTAPGNLRYAGFWIRVGAHLIDGIILSTVLGSVFFVFFGGTYIEIFSAGGRSRNAGHSARPRGDGGVDGAYDGFDRTDSVAGHGGESCLLCFFLGKVRSHSGEDGGRDKSGEAGRRAYLGGIRRSDAISPHILSAIILYIGHMMVGWDEQKRALHDRLAETRVVYKQS